MKPPIVPAPQRPRPDWVHVIPVATDGRLHPVERLDLSGVAGVTPQLRHGLRPDAAAHTAALVGVLPGMHMDWAPFGPATAFAGLHLPFTRILGMGVLLGGTDPANDGRALELFLASLGDFVPKDTPVLRDVLSCGQRPALVSWVPESLTQADARVLCLYQLVMSAAYFG